MIRLFVALSLPEALRARLSRLQEGLPGARWVDEDSLHLTLRFIGEVDQAMAADIDTALMQVKGEPFTLELSGIGTFETRGRPGTLWVGGVASPELLSLRDRIESAVTRAGLNREGRRFSPHVTLARLKEPRRDRLAHYIAYHNLFASGPVPIDTFTLFSSSLGRDGALYTPEATYPLGRLAKARGGAVEEGWEEEENEAEIEAEIEAEEDDSPRNQRTP